MTTTTTTTTTSSSSTTYEKQQQTTQRKHYRHCKDPSPSPLPHHTLHNNKQRNMINTTNRFVELSVVAKDAVVMRACDAAIDLLVALVYDADAKMKVIM